MKANYFNVEFQDKSVPVKVVAHYKSIGLNARINIKKNLCRHMPGFVKKYGAQLGMLMKIEQGIYFN